MSSFTEAMKLVDEIFVGVADNNMKRQVPIYIRINTRIRPEQHKFIKVLSKSKKRTEGEIFREIVDYYINKK